MIEKMEDKLEMKLVQNATIVLALFMVFNIAISILAASRQTKRINNKEPNNKIEAFLDERYPDERMDKIFSNKKYVK